MCAPVFQVEEFRARDARSGMKVAQVLEGFISRKVVKQTVMTVVYGVTRYGGRLQIEKQLKEIDEFPKVRYGSGGLSLRVVASSLRIFPYSFPLGVTLSHTGPKTDSL